MRDASHYIREAIANIDRAQEATPNDDLREQLRDLRSAAEATNLLAMAIAEATRRGLMTSAGKASS